ncbi:MAG: autotransporter-associated beta strand repeat-containing protein [Opitutaceae bacterium]
MKAGGGHLYLSVASIYTGVTTINEGALHVRANGGLGATGAGNGTKVVSTASTHGTLILENNITVAEDIALSFTDGTAQDVLQVQSGNSTVSGGLTLDRAGTSTGAYVFGISTSSGATLNLTGSITGQTTGTEAVTSDSSRLRITAGGTVNISGAISDGTIGIGGLSLYKQSSGILRLSGNNTYSGPTAHSAGVLLVNNTVGSGTGMGSVSVTGTAILGGVGIIAPAGSGGITFASGTKVSPGDYDVNGVSQTGMLTIALGNTTGSALFSTGSTMAFDFDVGLGLNDSLAFTGLSVNTARVSFSSNQINFSVTGGTLSDGLYTLATFDAANAYSGSWSIGSGLAGYDASLVFNADSIQLQIGSIPEPSSAALLVGGVSLFVMVAGRRRRRGVETSCV